VDRGAWGLELLMLLLALKLLNPWQVFLLRGNHESSTCTRFYGFKGEVDAKYSPSAPEAPGLGVPTEGIDDRSGSEGLTVSSVGCSPMLPRGVVPPMIRPHADAKVEFRGQIRLV
jgi:hypothetical protein